MDGRVQPGDLPPCAIQSFVEDPQKTGIALLIAPYIAARPNTQELENRPLRALLLPQFQEILEAHDG
jgi:hypothetical protein